MSVYFIRMALLVTILLMMINFSSNISSNSPSTNEFTAMDLWMLSNVLGYFELP